MHVMIRQTDLNLTVSEIESMIPFERDVYVGLQQNWIEEQKKNLEQ
jgi:hypothetical protein